MEGEDRKEEQEQVERNKREADAIHTTNIEWYWGRNGDLHISMHRSSIEPC